MFVGHSDFMVRPSKDVVSKYKEEGDRLPMTNLPIAIWCGFLLPWLWSKSRDHEKCWRLFLKALDYYYVNMPLAKWLQRPLYKEACLNQTQQWYGHLNLSFMQFHVDLRIGTQKNTRLKEIGLCAQNMLTNLGSIVNMIKRNMYDHLKSMGNLTLIMDTIFIWAPKMMRQSTTSTIWIC